MNISEPEFRECARDVNERLKRIEGQVDGHGKHFLVLAETLARIETTLNGRNPLHVRVQRLELWKAGLIGSGTVIFALASIALAFAIK